MKRLYIAAPLVFLAVAFVVYYKSTRHMGRIESLSYPITISGWSDTGLTTSDGRTVPVPGILHLPTTSAPLALATQHGIEVAPDGRLTCLVRVFHWCGNDPVTAEILRVDLSDMLTFLQVGEPTAHVPNPQMLARSPGGDLSAGAGWNISEYSCFQLWQSTEDDNVKP